MYMCTRAATTHTLTRVNNMIHALKRRYTHVRTRAYTPHTKTLDAYPHARTPHSHITIYWYAHHISIYRYAQPTRHLPRES